MRSPNPEVRPYAKTGIECKSGTPEYAREYYRRFLAGNKKSRHNNNSKEEVEN